MVHAEIRGKVKGDIYGAGRVRVTSTGFCSSRIRADYLEVAGEVAGAVEARRLVVLSTGRVLGGARARSLFVQPGGVLDPQDHPIPGTRQPAPPVSAPVLPAAPVSTVPLPAAPVCAAPLPGLQAPHPVPRSSPQVPHSARQVAQPARLDGERHEELVKSGGPVFYTSF